MPKVVMNAKVLELHSREKDGKTYNSLIVYESGQRFPQVTKVSLLPDQLQAVAPAVGKNAVVVCDMSTYDGRVNYQFREFGRE